MLAIRAMPSRRPCRRRDGASPVPSERDRSFEEPLLVLYRHTDYSVSMLREYFQNGRAGLNRETAEILADHLHATVGRVIEIAKEIDN